VTTLSPDTEAELIPNVKGPEISPILSRFFPYPRRDAASYNEAMLRDTALIPLSHQHQHALALCVRIERALKKPGADLAKWNREAASLFADEVRYHFEAEEKWIFPVAQRFPELATLVVELLAEHAQMREAIKHAAAGELDAATLARFARLLSTHIRKEERRLFEELQRLLPPAVLAALGAQLKDYFGDRGLLEGQSCRLS
jgi:hemerythrin-like domain-containing protein